MMDLGRPAGLCRKTGFGRFFVDKTILFVHSYK